MWKGTQKSNPKNVADYTDAQKEAIEKHNSTKGKYMFVKIESKKPIETLKTEDKPDKKGKE